MESKTTLPVPVTRAPWRVLSGFTRIPRTVVLTAPAGFATCGKIPGASRSSPTANWVVFGTVITVLPRMVLTVTEGPRFPITASLRPTFVKDATPKAEPLAASVEQPVKTPGFAALTGPAVRHVYAVVCALPTGVLLAPLPPL